LERWICFATVHDHLVHDSTTSCAAARDGDLGCIAAKGTDVTCDPVLGELESLTVTTKQDVPLNGSTHIQQTSIERAVLGNLCTAEKAVRA